MSKQSSSRKLPRGWVATSLGDLCEFVGGGTPSKAIPSYWNGDIPWATVKDFGDRDFLDATRDSITIEGLENSSARIAHPGQVLLITRMSVGRTVISNITTAINQDLKIVRPYVDIPSEFIHFSSPG